MIWQISNQESKFRIFPTKVTHLPVYLSIIVSFRRIKLFLKIFEILGLIHFGESGPSCVEIFGKINFGGLFFFLSHRLIHFAHLSHRPTPWNRATSATKTLNQFRPNMHPLFRHSNPGLFWNSTFHTYYSRKILCRLVGGPYPPIFSEPGHFVIFFISEVIFR